MLAVIDCYSKFLWLFALRNKEAIEVANSLKKIMFTYGVGPPVELQSDNGKEFVNELMTNLCSTNGIKEIHSLPYSPNVQGVVERQNLTIGRMFVKHRENQLVKGLPFNWADADVISAVNWQYNTQFHTSIEMTPFECFYGRAPNGEYTVVNDNEQIDANGVREM
jgi:transposase InsO family protein